MKTTSHRSTHIRPGGPGPFNSKISLMSIPLTEANFFKSILLRKNWQGGGELLLSLRMYNRYSSYANKPCYCPGLIYIELDPIRHFGIFAIFSCQIQVKTKKMSYLSAGPLALCYMLNPSLVMALR